MIDKKTFEASKGSAYMRRHRKAECCRLLTFGLVISSATSITIPLHAAPNNPVPYHYTGQIQLNVNIEFQLRKGRRRESSGHLTSTSSAGFRSMWVSSSAVSLRGG
jgi:hypothetical protein